MRRQPAAMRRQRGLSIVEMMVGVAIGLLVVAAAALVVSSQLVENRRLMLETQVQQDLRAAADIITRELRRAGSWNVNNSARNAAWYSGGAGVTCNFYATINVGAPTTEVDYRYWRQSGQDGPLGFRLSGGKIQYALTASNPPPQSSCLSTVTAITPSTGWQDLTDSKVMTVTTFSVAPPALPPAPLQLPCPKLCADGTTDCWPTVAVRELIVTLVGEAVSDPSVQRTITSNVRLRNDWVQFNDAANPLRMCPV